MVEPSPLPLVDLLGALPVAVVVVDADVRVASWNAAAEALYGHRGESVVGRDALEVLFDPEDQAQATTVLADAARGTSWEGDGRVRRSDEMLLVSSFRAVPLGDGGVAWIATDPIDQGLAEEERAVLLGAEHAARATAEDALGLVEAILSAAPVGIAVVDLDLRYVRVNDAYAALSGVPEGDHIGGRVGDELPLPPQVGADLRRVVTTGRTILGRHFELARARRADDRRHFNVSYFPVRGTSGAVVGAGATVVEVTESKRAEAERADLLAKAEAAQQRLAILATASTVLTTTMELDEMLVRLARVLAPSAADWAIIELVDERGTVEHVAVANRDSGSAAELAGLIRSTPVRLDGDGPVAEVLRTGQALLLQPDSIDAALRDAAADRGTPELAAGYSVASSVIVPIEARGERLGALLLSTERGRLLGDDDVDLAVEIAHRAALAITNARAFQQEHEIAETLQRALLPAAVPAVAGLDTAVRYVAASDRASVGGDWYDVIAFDDGVVGLVVGDVVGHDIAASTTMGQLRSALRAYACEAHAAPSATFARVHNVFDLLDLTMATCVLAVVDPAVRRLRWCSAGHPPPLLLRDGKATFLTGGESMMLGVPGEAAFVDGLLELIEGDVLVLYTDGLVERRTEGLDAGLARLAAAVQRIASTQPDDLADALLAELVPVDRERDDDVAILVARIGADRPANLHRLDLEASPESVALARGFAAGILTTSGWHDHVDTVCLLISELVTNALRHASPPCAVELAVGDEVLELRVSDGSSQHPAARDSDVLDESGRGFVIVAALADEWGVRSSPDGKTTWFALRRS